MGVAPTHTHSVLKLVENNLDNLRPLKTLSLEASGENPGKPPNQKP